MYMYAKKSGMSLTAVDSYGDVELDQFLLQFYGGPSKTDQTLYTQKSKHAIRYGIHCQFLSVRDSDKTKNDPLKRATRCTRC